MEKDRWDLTYEIAFQEKKTDYSYFVLYSALYWPSLNVLSKISNARKVKYFAKISKSKSFLTKMIESATSSNHSDGKSEIRLDFFSRSSAKYFEVEPSRMLFWCNYKIFLVVFVAGWSHVALSIKHPLTEKRYIF